MANEKYIVYIDLDGVLAGFEEKLKDAFGKSREEMSKGELWGRIKKYNEEVEPWFANLPKREDADELFQYVTNNFDNVQILTATGKTPSDAAQQKREWVKKNYGAEVVVNTVQSANDKAVYANPRAILIDDREKSIKPFIKAGGYGILHRDTTSTINKMKTLMRNLWRNYENSNY